MSDDAVSPQPRFCGTEGPGRDNPVTSSSEWMGSAVQPPTIACQISRVDGAMEKLLQGKFGGRNLTSEVPPPPVLQRELTGVRLCATCPCVMEPEPVWARQCSDCFRDDTTKRKCKVCDKARIPVSEPTWKVVCGSCYKNSPMKPCQGCNEFNLRAYETRPLCKTCYTNKNWARTCEGCNARPIKDGMPSYVKLCPSCYINNKKETHEKCGGCTGERAEKMTKRKGTPFCRQCLQEKGLVMSNVLPFIAV